MIAVSEGENRKAMALFNSLGEAAKSGDVPADGVADARATACLLTDDPEVRKKLVGDMVESAAAARCLVGAGDTEMAKAAAAPGKFKMYLERL